MIASRLLRTSRARSFVLASLAFIPLIGCGTSPSGADTPGASGTPPSAGSGADGHGDVGGPGGPHGDGGAPTGASEGDGGAASVPGNPPGTDPSGPEVLFHTTSCPSGLEALTVDSDWLYATCRDPTKSVERNAYSRFRFTKLIPVTKPGGATDPVDLSPFLSSGLAQGQVSSGTMHFWYDAPTDARDYSVMSYNGAGSNIMDGASETRVEETMCSSCIGGVDPCAIFATPAGLFARGFKSCMQDSIVFTVVVPPYGNETHRVERFLPAGQYRQTITAFWSQGSTLYALSGMPLGKDLGFSHANVVSVPLDLHADPTLRPLTGDIFEGAFAKPSGNAAIASGRVLLAMGDRIVSIDSAAGVGTTVAKLKSTSSSTTIVSDGAHAYFTDPGTRDATGQLVTNTGAIQRLDPDGSVTTVYAGGNPTEIVIDDQYMYWIDTRISPTNVSTIFDASVLRLRF
jgi:hypothetical protein